MSEAIANIEFVVKAVPFGGGATEFQQSMAPHPLIYQELPYDPKFGVYNSRLRSLAYGNTDTRDLYWRLRRQVMMSHTGELPLEIRGPDAEALLERVFTRSVAKVRVGRCSYQIACYPDGGTIMDGVLMRLDSDRFWYVQGDGEFYSWLRAQAVGFDVEIFNPHVWVSQVQGPRSMDVLEAVADEGMPERFRYFDLAEIHIDGQRVIVTRTGFTSELGWEFYLEPGVNAAAIGERIMYAGKEWGIHTTPAEVTNARRIEGGLLFVGTDFDQDTTPFDVGFGRLVDFDKGDFVGRAALEAADRRNRTWGLKVDGGTPYHGDSVSLEGNKAGRVTSSSWSPSLQCGIAFVRLDDRDQGPGTVLDVACMDGQTYSGEVCELPFYDRNGDIARGRVSELPEIPAGLSPA